MFLDREQGRAGLAIEQEDVAGLGGLRDGIARLAVVHHRHEHRRRRQVAIPHVVVDELVMPDALAGGGVQHEQAVGEAGSRPVRLPPQKSKAAEPVGRNTRPRA